MDQTANQPNAISKPAGRQNGPAADVGRGPQSVDFNRDGTTDAAGQPVAPGKGANAARSGNMDFVMDIPQEISVELGRTRMKIHELLKLSQGSVVELAKLAGESLDIFANQRLIARGEVVVLNEKYGIRLTEIVSPAERIERLG